MCSYTLCTQPAKHGLARASEDVEWPPDKSRANHASIAPARWPLCVLFTVLAVCKLCAAIRATFELAGEDADWSPDEAEERAHVDEEAACEQAIATALAQGATAGVAACEVRTALDCSVFTLTRLLRDCCFSAADTCC